jgi:proline iminopeptidase
MKISFLAFTLVPVLACTVALRVVGPSADTARTPLSSNVQSIAVAQLPQGSPAEKNREGYVTTDDGVRIFYQVVGDGPQTLVLPGRLFLIHTMRQLAAGRRLIFYDTRARGRSDPIHDATRETIMDDVRDLEAVRRHFGAEKFVPVGYSYMGLLVILYAKDHPQHVERVIQMGPVPMDYRTKYPAGLSEDYNASLDPAGAKKLDELQKQGFDRSHPKEYCEQEWNVSRFALVGDPAHVDRIGIPKTGLCEFTNEWPVNLDSHFEASFASIQKVQLTKEELAKVSMPVLTIHGTKDRNAPYGSGREWAMTLPNARLLTVPGGAHQSFDEYPEIVLPAIDQFLKGSWPKGTERVTSINPSSK